MQIAALIEAGPPTGDKHLFARHFTFECKRYLRALFRWLFAEHAPISFPGLWLAECDGFHFMPDFMRASAGRALGFAGTLPGSFLAHRYS